jgi:hypothetical protein
MSESLFTLGFPLKKDTDTKALSDQLAPMLPALFKAADEIGTFHYSRFVVLSARTLLFLGEFDDEFGPLMRALARSAGPVFDAIFPHVDGAPPVPVAENVEAFVEWTATHLFHAAIVFSAYPDVTAKQIKALASGASLAGSGEQHPFLVGKRLRNRVHEEMNSAPAGNLVGRSREGIPAWQGINSTWQGINSAHECWTRERPFARSERRRCIPATRAPSLASAVTISDEIARPSSRIAMRGGLFSTLALASAS